MFIAGEPSGDILASELVQALRQRLATFEPAPTNDYQPLQSTLDARFFGAGGPRMAAAGVEVFLDMTQHSVIGLSDALKNVFKFRRIFHQLFRLALEREPDLIICVDFAGFNRRVAHAVRRNVRSRAGWFQNWHPRIVQFVSPQVWASRESRVYQIAEDYDLLLSIFPFEKEWYAKRVPRLRVEFVGHPIVDRYANLKAAPTKPSAASQSATDHADVVGLNPSQSLLLLPGSRPGELARHLPVMLKALAVMRNVMPDLPVCMVVPNESLLEQAKQFGLPADVTAQVGGLPEILQKIDVAIASTGTVTMECAYFGVPTVAMYKTSWTTFAVAKQIIKVRYLAMPNLLVGEELFPEFIQYAATPEHIARAALDLLGDENRRQRIKARLAEIVSSLGGPGATQRAANAIVRLVDLSPVLASSAALD